MSGGGPPLKFHGRRDNLDGGAHLHIWFFARPAGQPQLLGSWLVVWDDLLPEYPSVVAERDSTAVADALVSSYGGLAS